MDYCSPGTAEEKQNGLHVKFSFPKSNSFGVLVIGLVVYTKTIIWWIFTLPLIVAQ